LNGLAATSCSAQGFKNVWQKFARFTEVDLIKVLGVHGRLEIHQNGGRTRCIRDVDQPCSRIDMPRTANHDEQVGFFNCRVNCFHLHRHFSEPNDIVAQALRDCTALTVKEFITKISLLHPYLTASALLTTKCFETPMHMDGAFIARSFMKVIDILRNEREVIRLGCKGCKRLVRSVRLNFKQLTASGLIKPPNGVATSSIRCSSHKPSPSRKVRKPDSAEIPAPVKTTTRCCAIETSQPEGI